MNWSRWSKQIDAIVRLELRRYWLGRRWIGIYILALAPCALLLLQAIVGRHRESAATLNVIYAAFYQAFLLRFAVFFACMTIFSQLFRGEILEKTLHYYLMTPVRRDVLAIGKYLAGLVASIVLFGGCTIVTYVLMFAPMPFAREFFASGPGIPHLARYVAVTMLGSLGYGAVFLLVGLHFRNPMGPAILILGWEYFNFLMPPLLQKISVVHYLQSLCPVGIPKSPFAVVTDPTPPVIGIPGLLIFTALILTIAAIKVRRLEVTYSAD